MSILVSGRSSVGKSKMSTRSATRGKGWHTKSFGLQVLIIHAAVDYSLFWMMRTIVTHRNQEHIPVVWFPNQCTRPKLALLATQTVYPQKACRNRYPVLQVSHIALFWYLSLIVNHDSPAPDSMSTLHLVPACALHRRLSETLSGDECVGDSLHNKQVQSSGGLWELRHVPQRAIHHLSHPARIW